MKRDKPRRRLLIVDGYNVINARKEGVSGSLADAREALIHRMGDYAGYSGQKIILVFDAWLSDRLQRTTEQIGPVEVVYTQKGETADHYIERLCDSLSNDIELRRVEVRVATSDSMEQTIVLGRGAIRLSSRELMFEMEQTRALGQPKGAAAPAAARSTIMDRLPEDIRRKLDEMRKGE